MAELPVIYLIHFVRFQNRLRSNPRGPFFSREHAPEKKPLCELCTQAPCHPGYATVSIGNTSVLRNITDCLICTEFVLKHAIVCKCNEYWIWNDFIQVWNTGGGGPDHVCWVCITSQHTWSCPPLLVSGKTTEFQNARMLVPKFSSARTAFCSTTPWKTTLYNIPATTLVTMETN